MFIGNADLQETTSIDTDICIIGSGAAGISMAKSFLNTNIRVAVIEAGGFEYDSESQEVYKGRNIGLPYPPLDVTRLRYFGGSTNHWEGNVYPFKVTDFDKHDWLPNSGWPIRKGDLDPYYQEAFDICMFGTGAYQWSKDYWQNELDISSSLPDEKIFKLSFYQRMRRMVPSFQSFGTYIKDELQKSENISVYVNLNVIELNTNDDGDRIASVSLLSKSGKSLTLRARDYVLATGGIENARLLLVSNSTIKDGIGNQNGLVGRYFCEHPVVYAGKLLTSGKHSIEKIFDVHDTASGPWCLAQLSPSFEYQKNNRLVSSFVRLFASPLPASDSGLSARRILNGLNHGELPENLLNEIGTVITDIDTLLERQYYKLSRVKPEYYTISVRIEPAPNYDSRIFLINEKDKFGKQRVALDWKVGDAARRTMLNITNAFASEMGRMGIGRVRINPKLESEWENHFHVGNHQMCTTRMASSARNGVVDKNCKVFSMANLYTAGSSVFSTGGSGTPTLTLVALALRLAEHLKGMRV